MSTVESAITHSQRAIIRYLSSSMNRFYISMWKKQRDNARDIRSMFSGQSYGAPEKFKKELKKVQKYSKENITKSTLSIYSDIEGNYPYFGFDTHLANITQSMICVYSNIGEQVCKPGNTVVIDKEMLLEFIYECMVACSSDLSQVPRIFQLKFGERERVLKFIYDRNILNCILDFVFRYENRLAGNTLIQQTFQPDQQEEQPSYGFRDESGWGGGPQHQDQQYENLPRSDNGEKRNEYSFRDEYRDQFSSDRGREERNHTHQPERQQTSGRGRQSYFHR